MSWVESWSVLSSTETSTYTVSRDTEGFFGCTCLGWVKQRKPFAERKPCRHILEKRLDLQVEKTKALVSTFCRHLAPKDECPTCNPKTKTKPPLSFAVLPQGRKFRSE